MAEQPARPRVVNWCAWLIMIGGGFLVLLAYQHVSELGSLESQEEAGRLVSEPPFEGLGLSVDDVQQVERVLSLLAGASGAAAAILGFEVLRRSRTARRVLSFLAPVILFAGSVVGGLLAFVVVAAVVMLWSPQAREWYGDPVRTPPPRRPEPEPEPAPLARTEQPPRDGTTAVLAPPAPWPQVSDRPAVRRPGVVLAAAIVTWVSCGLVAAGSLASMVVVLASPDDLVDQLHEQNPQLADQGIGDGFVVGVVIVTVVGLVLWSIAAAVLAFLSVRGRRWAAITLLVSGGLAGALCLVSTILGGVVAVVPLAATVAAFVLLNRPESKAWYRTQR